MIKSRYGLYEGVAIKFTSLMEDNKAMQNTITALQAENEKLKAQCETCPCAKFADEAIKPSMMLELISKLKANQ